MKAELLTLLLLAAPATARPRAVPPIPSAEALLLKAFSAPAEGYQVRERVQVFAPGRKPKGRTFIRTVAPDGRVRIETAVAKRSRKQPMVFVRGAGTAALSWPDLNRFWSGPIAEESARDTVERLKELFTLTVSSGGRVAKRATWRVDLRQPDGRLRRTLWVGRDDALLLKRETYGVDGLLARRERVMSLESPRRVAESDFVLSAPEGAKAGDWSMPMKEKPGASSTTAASSPFVPGWIPDGFLLMSVDVLGAPREPRYFMSYADGASVLTVTEADPAADASAPAGYTVRSVRLSSVPCSVYTGGGTIQVLCETHGRLLLATGSGGLTEDDLARVVGSVRMVR